MSPALSALSAPPDRLAAADLPGLVGIPLSDEQLAAATAPLAPQLIVAGAGTGKTTVMAARVVWLVASGQVTADQVLGLTFTNKAAAELSHRIRTALGRLGPRGALPAGAEDAGDPTVLTYHAFAGRLVTQYGPLLGVESDARMVADGQRARIAHEVACDPLDATGLTGTPRALGELVRAMDDTLADLDIGVAELHAHDGELLALLAQAQGPGALVDRMVTAAEHRRRIAALVAQFREAKLAGELLDFADQVRLGAGIATGIPLAGEQLRHRFRVVLLDEYQDTSRAQRRTLQALFRAGHPVTAVGDPCQAIYGWRGASVTNIDEFPRHFRRADDRPADVHELTTNRRSRPAILAAANRVSAPLRGFHTVARPLRPPARAEGGELRCALLPTWDAELAWLGEQVADVGTRRGWRDVAVLCRSNDQVAATVAHLRGVGIPASVTSRRDLLALPEVASVTALLRVLVDPYANPDVLHHLVGPRWRIGPRDLAILGRRARDLAHATAQPGGASADVPISLGDAVHDPGGPTYEYSTEGRERLAGFAAELDELDELRGRPVADVVSAAIEQVVTGLVGVDVATVPESLDSLVALAHGFRSLDGSRGLVDFVAYLDDCLRFDGSPQDEGPPRVEGVAVMTVHAAKGLEFPVVAVPFCSDGVFPEGRGRSRWVTSARAVPPVPADEPDPARTLGFPGASFTTKDHDAYVRACRFDDRLDEDRLAYVAMTRAKDALIVSGHWWGPTQTRPRGPSDYLLAVRHECEAAGGTVGPWTGEPGERPDDAANATTGLSPMWPGPVADDAVVRLAAELTSAPEPVAGNPWHDTVERVIAARSASPPDALSTPPVVSVSALTTWLRTPDAFREQLRRPMPRRPSAAAARGTAFHSWMEQRAGQQVLFELPGAEPGQTDRFEAMLARTRFAERAPHVVEQPFVLAIDDLVVTGRIDAVFAVTGDPAHDWEVVDWKTGDPRHADPAQLAVYRAAWSRITGCPASRILASFVFLSDGTDQRHDDLPDARTVVASLRRGGDMPGG